MNFLNFFGSEMHIKFIVLLFFIFIRSNAEINFENPAATIAFDKTTSVLNVLAPLTVRNGTIKLNSSALSTNLTGTTTSFNNGTLFIGQNQTDFSGGQYTLSGTVPQISLANGQILSVSSGSSVYPQLTVTASSSATIVGTPLFSYPITLSNSTSTLNLGLEHKLNQNISLNGGKIVLLNKLELADGVQLTGTGTVDLANKSLSLSGAANPWSSALTFWRANDIQLESSLTLSSNWNFLTPPGSPTDNISVINGNGNVLTLSTGANLLIGDSNGGHTLYINDLIIKGLTNQTTLSPSFKGLTLSEFQAAYPSSTYGSAAYANNFIAVSGVDANGTTRANSYQDIQGTYPIAIYDGPPGSPLSNPILYYDATGSTACYSHVLTSTARTLFSTNPMFSLDVGADGTLLTMESTSSPSYSTTIDIWRWTGAVRTFMVTYGQYYVIKACIADLNNTYAANANGVYRRFPSSQTTIGTGFSNIAMISASQDGTVWVIDKGTNNFYRLVQGQTAATATKINFTDANGTTIAASAVGLCAKGTLSTANSLHVVVCTPDLIYHSTDGTNFSLVGPSFSAGTNAFLNVAVGANGTIAFQSNPAATPASTVFVKSPMISTTTTGNINLYDSATSANRGKVVLSNCSLVLSGSYTHSAGEIRIAGDNCTLITGGNKTFNITSTNAPLIVDSVALIYECLGGNNVSPFSSSPNAPTLTNGGVVRSARPDLVTHDTTFDANATPTPPALGWNYSFFTPYTSGFDTWSNRIVVSNSASLGTPKSITIDGGNYTWNFPTNSGACMVIDHDTTVTLQNVLLKNFSLDKVAFNATANLSPSTPTTANGSGAKLVFGQNCVIELAENQTLTGDGSVSTATSVFNFAPGAGNTARIRGRNLNLNLQNNQCLKLSSAGTLVIENTNINTSGSPTALACTNTAGTIELKDCNLKINSAGLNYTTGNLSFSGWTSVNSATNAGSPAVLCFYQQPAGSGVLTIKDSATLEIGRNCTLSYACPSKTQLVMASNSSTLFFNCSKLDAYTKYLGNSNFGTGVRLAQGNFVIDGKTFFVGSPTAGQEIEISAAANFEILASAILDSTGGVKYTS